MACTGVVDVATGASTEAPLPLDCWCLKSAIVGSNETKYDPGKLAQDAVRAIAHSARGRPPASIAAAAKRDLREGNAAQQRAM